MRKRQGFVVAPTIVLAMVCLTLCFTVAAVSTFQLNAASHQQDSEAALYLAEGAMAQAMSHLHDGIQTNKPYGRGGQDVKFTPFTDRMDAFGEVTFVQGTPWGYATNNQDGAQGTGWDKTTIPQGDALLVARGVYRNSTRLIEAMVAMPLYSYVIASDGAIDSGSNPIIIQQEPSMAALQADNGVPGNALGANMGSNTSISSGAGTPVTGDVVCPGAVNLGSGSEVDGSVRNAPVSLPAKLSVLAYNNQVGGAALPAPKAGVVDVVQNSYAAGPLTIGGDLKLEGCLVYVDGDLTIGGGLSGTGALVVNGNVEIDTGADLDASSVVALLASGNVKLTNTSAATKKYFQGLVYTEGGFSASNITIAGAFVSTTTGPESSGTGGITLGANTRVVYVSSAVNVQPPAPVSAANIIGLSGSGVFPNGGIGWGPTQPLPGPGDEAPACITPYQGNPIFTAAINSDPLVATQLTNYSVQLGDWNDQNTGLRIAYDTVYYNTVAGKFEQLNPPNEQLTQNGNPISLAAWDAAQTPGLPTAERLIQAMQAAQAAYVTAANQMLNPPPFQQTSPAAAIPNLSLNNFLSDSSPLHIITWREPTGPGP